jgi:hypothetical protein
MVLAGNNIGYNIPGDKTSGVIHLQRRIVLEIEYIGSKIWIRH